MVKVNVVVNMHQKQCEEKTKKKARMTFGNKCLISKCMNNFRVLFDDMKYIH